jgi:hypothetical protein
MSSDEDRTEGKDEESSKEEAEEYLDTQSYFLKWITKI